MIIKIYRNGYWFQIDPERPFLRFLGGSSKKVDLLESKIAENDIDGVADIVLAELKSFNACPESLCMVEDCRKMAKHSNNPAYHEWAGKIAIFVRDLARGETKNA